MSELMSYLLISIVKPGVSGIVWERGASTGSVLPTGVECLGCLMIRCVQLPHDLTQPHEAYLFRCDHGEQPTQQAVHVLAVFKQQQAGKNRQGADPGLDLQRLPVEDMPQ
jgi:hypothetical protein